MKRQTTKEELIRQVSYLEERVGNYNRLSEERLLEFAKAFNWKKSSYHSNGEYRIPTWSEIFVEVGRLLANQKYQDNSNVYSDLSFKINDLESRLSKNQEHE